MTPPLLAARLAGGLLHSASRESIEIGIRAALKEPNLLEDIAPVRDLPGVTRALHETLRNVWRAGFDLKAKPYVDKPRVRDLIEIEETIRLHLQPGECLLPDLCELARAAVQRAPRVVGPLLIRGAHAIDPLWQPLLNDLREVISVEWAAPVFSDVGWFNGTLRRASAKSGSRRAISCTDPYHETLEAMRWARELLASGRVRASDIAIATTAPAAYDDYVLALSSASGLPVSFVHGRPALSTRDGQRCAALADALQAGLSQARVRRLLSLVRNQGTRLDGIVDGHLPVPSEASLSTADDWRRVLLPYPEVASILVPVLELLERGAAAAEEAGKLLLRGRSRSLWEEALRSAPASALMFSLGSLRVAEESDPADSIAWCSADELAGAPRRFAWLLGMTVTGWPRTDGLDPILPEYVVPASRVSPDSIEAADRRCLDNILASTEEVVLSCGRLSREGKAVGASALMPPVEPECALRRDSPPRHAVSESDRLLARPQDRRLDPLVSSALTAWRDWSVPDLTHHDGFVGAQHPLLATLFMRPQSPTSLSRLLRDPLAYVWYYALGWRDLVHKERALVLPPDDMGRLVHELLRRTVDYLEQTSGFTVAARYEVEDALGLASDHVIKTWPLVMNVPPPVLWTNTVRRACEMSLEGLTFESFTEAGTLSWTEVVFGGEKGASARSTRPPPWDPTEPVLLPGTDINIQGTIDRLDLRASAVAVRVTDYKTGQRPEEPDELIVAGGAELQRILYSLACRVLLPDTKPLVARLIYLRTPVQAYPLKNPDSSIDLVASWVKIARSVLEAGNVYPGVATMLDRFGQIALPAAARYVERRSNSIARYVERKSSAIRQAAGKDLIAYWRAK